MSARSSGSAILELVYSTVPVLQGTVALAWKIVDLARAFSVHKDQWEEFGNYVQSSTEKFTAGLNQTRASQIEIRKKLEKFYSVLQNIAKEVGEERDSPRHRRIVRLMRDPSRIADMKARLREAVELFQLDITISKFVAVDNTHRITQSNQGALAAIQQQAAFIAAKLHRAAKASWDPDTVCLPGTRARLVQEIIEWANSQHHKGIANGDSSIYRPEGAKIMLLTGVAGAGKTTIAHTVAQHFHNKKSLGSSFFFDREDNDRTKLVTLFNTIAADLANFDPLLAKRMCSILEQDWALPSAPISRQFNDLLLETLIGYSSNKPVVLVIDGLDEGWDDILVQVLRVGAARLPNSFRIFLTSRMRPELADFCRESYVSWLELDISSQDNMTDITTFIDHKLQWLAFKRQLGQDWPGERLRARFTTRAGGLFLWVTIVCDYLRGQDDPTLELEKLLSTQDPLASTAEGQMNHLYTTILDSFNWKDASFNASYQRLIGTTLASKIPLTVTVMQDLLQVRPLANPFTFHKLSPLLTGMREMDHQTISVRVLHQSLRDFLVVRAPNAKYFVSETIYNQFLTRLCLNILNRELGRYVTGTDAFSATWEPLIYLVDKGQIPEALQYSCQFWSNHVLDGQIPAIMIQELEDFLYNRVEAWMKMLALLGVCRELNAARTCIGNFVAMKEDSVDKLICILRHTLVCLQLSEQLDGDNRYEEAQEVRKGAKIGIKSLLQYRRAYQQFTRGARNDSFSTQVEHVLSRLSVYGLMQEEKDKSLEAM